MSDFVLRSGGKRFSRYQNSRLMEPHKTPTELRNGARRKAWIIPKEKSSFSMWMVP